MTGIETGDHPLQHTPTIGAVDPHLSQGELGVETDLALRTEIPDHLHLEGARGAGPEAGADRHPGEESLAVPDDRAQHIDDKVYTV